MRCNKLLKITKSLIPILGILFIFGCDSSGGSGGPKGGAAPAVPTGVTLTEQENQLMVNWSASEGAEKYTVYCGTVENHAVADKKLENITLTNTLIPGLAGDTTYHVWVQAHNSYGSSNVSTRASGSPRGTEGPVIPVVPAAPTGVTVTAADSQLTVSWNASQGASSYKVYYSAANTKPANTDKTGITGTTVVLTGLANNTTYNVWVVAGNTAGDSAASTVTSGMPKAAVTAPAAPINVTATAEGFGELILNWSAPEGATIYKVYSSKTNTMPATVTKSGITSTTLTITGLINDTTYYVWVVASNSAGDSLPSAVASGKTKLPLPEAPLDVTVTTAGNGAFKVKWSASQGASSYKIYYNTSDSMPAEANKTGITGTAETITGLANDTTYYIWVKAANSAGESIASNVASKKTILPAPAVPAGVTVTEADRQLTINWNDVPGAEFYIVYWNTEDNYESANIFHTITTDSDGFLYTEVLVDGLINGATYYFWIAAGNSADSSEVSTVVSGIPNLLYGPITAPTDITVFVKKKNMTVSFSAVPGAVLYVVYRTTSPTPPNIESKSGANTKIKVQNSVSGTTYYIWVKAVSSSGDYSDFSEMITFTMP